MQKVTLQIPMNEQLKIEAERAALDQGFSSLQELVRVILFRVAQRKIEINVEEVIILSEKADKRYARAMKDFKEGKNVYTAKNVDDFLRQLNAK